MDRTTSQRWSKKHLLQVGGMVDGQNPPPGTHHESIYHLVQDLAELSGAQVDLTQWGGLHRKKLDKKQKRLIKTLPKAKTERVSIPSTDLGQTFP